MDRVNMINTIVRDYRKELENSYTEAYGDDWNMLEVEAQVSDFLEQLQFFYRETQLIELYQLVIKNT